MKLDGATVLLQWATGGLLFLWVTTRRREVGIGYGWLLRGTYLLMAAGAVGRSARAVPSATRSGVTAVRGALSCRCSGGPACRRARAASRARRVAAMTGIERAAQARDRPLPEFPPALDLVAPAIGVVGLVAAGVDAGGPTALALAAHAGRRRVPRRRSPTPCSSATGTSCSPACPAAPLLELVRWVGIAVAVRGRRSCSWPDRHGLGAHRHRSTTATAACSAGSGWPARSRPSCWWS